MRILQRTALLALAFILILFLYQPVLGFGFVGVPLIVLGLVVLWNILRFKDEIKDVLEGKVMKPITLDKISLSIMGLVFVYLVGYGFVSTHPLLNSGEYRNLIGDVKTGGELEKHISPISIEKIRVVDEDLANIVGEKILGSQPALGSQVRLGRFNIQRVNNELYWVAPLLHSGFFKWLNNLEGSNGYVMVSATNERDVRLIQKLGDKEVRIKYQPESYLFQNIDRYVYFNGYLTKGITDFSFEIDDQGNPFWVITLFKKTIGFSGDNAVGVVTVAANTGTIKEYAINDAPKWIDRIQPSSFIEQQLNNWGEYVRGYWNFSNEDKLQITEGVSLVYGEDGRAYWYTGLTSVGSDESTVGFVLVDTRSKEAIWYHQSGATEIAAQSSAMGKVQEKGYRASLPIPYNINGIPTYVMTLKDRGGLVKMYALVAVRDYTIVGVGNTIREALSAFKTSYNQSDNKVFSNNVAGTDKLKDVVERIGFDVRNGNCSYYIVTKGSKSIYIGSTQLSPSIAVTQKGDSIEFTYDTSSSDVVDITSFSNLSLQRK